MSFILQPLHVFVAVLIEYVRDPLAAETSHVTAQETPKSIRIHILEVADTEAQLARAPPSAPCATASLSTRDISRAA